MISPLVAQTYIHTNGHNPLAQYILLAHIRKVTDHSLNIILDLNFYGGCHKVKNTLKKLA